MISAMGVSVYDSIHFAGFWTFQGKPFLSQFSANISFKDSVVNPSNTVSRLQNIAVVLSKYRFNKEKCAERNTK
jgi:hypothetical protein